MWTNLKSLGPASRAKERTDFVRLNEEVKMKIFFRARSPTFYFSMGAGYLARKSRRKDGARSRCDPRAGEPSTVPLTSASPRYHINSKQPKSSS